MGQVRRARTADLRPEELAALRALLDAAWADPDEAFTDEDWEHTVGGTHFLVERDGAIVAHAAVVERELHAGEHRLATGYVEGVATLPGHRGRGHATAIVREVGEHLDRSFELGGLGTDLHAFYGRLGWVTWRGPTYVRTDAGPVPTPEEDGFVMVRMTPSTPELDLSAPLGCDWRPGDVW